MEQKNQPQRLGKGLAAIIQEGTLSFHDSGFIPDVPIGDIEPNPSQPRAEIKPEDIIGLADSIREYGIIEPLIVSNKKGSDNYTLIAGERRWRAAKLARVDTVPVIVKDVSPQKILELAVVENIQRQDLNPIEEAMALSELYNKYRVKLEELSKKIGKDISTVSNKMRLLKLPQEVQEGMLREKITESHAYVLLALKNKDAMLVVYNMTLKKHFSVRQTDELVRKLNLANKAVEDKPKKSNAIIYDEKTQSLSEELGKKLGQGFKLIRKKNGGRITIPFTSEKQLDALYKFLTSGNFGS